MALRWRRASLQTQGGGLEGLPWGGGSCRIWRGATAGPVQPQVTGTVQAVDARVSGWVREGLTWGTTRGKVTY